MDDFLALGQAEDEATFRLNALWVLGSVGTAEAVLGMGGGSKSVLHGDLLAPANTQELQAVVGHMEQSYKNHKNFIGGNVQYVQLKHVFYSQNKCFA